MKFNWNLFAKQESTTDPMQGSLFNYDEFVYDRRRIRRLAFLEMLGCFAKQHDKLRTVDSELQLFIAVHDLIRVEKEPDWW